MQILELAKKVFLGQIFSQCSPVDEWKDKMIQMTNLKVIY